MSQYLPIATYTPTTQTIADHLFSELRLAHGKPSKISLIGKGFLNRGQAMMISAAPGVGKSAFTFHLACHLALGRSFLGLKPSGKFRVLYYQNEDTEDDLGEFAAGLCEQLDLSDEEVEMLDRNLLIRTAVGVSGDTFIAEVTREIGEEEPDIVVTDPLFSFIGANVADQVSMSKFLREQMAAVLRRHQCGWICVHHNNRKENGNSGYKAFGSIELAAFFRAIIELSPLKGNDVKLEVVKRARQSGLHDSYGKPTDTLHLSKGCSSITWNLCQVQPAPQAVIVRTSSTGAVGRAPKVPREEVAKCISELRDAGTDDAELPEAIAAKFGYSLKQAGRICDELGSELSSST